PGRVPERRQISAVDAELRRVLARVQPGDEVSDLLRKRFPIRARSVDFHDGDGLGQRRACPGCRCEVRRCRDPHSPPFSRRGGCAINKKPRSVLKRADGVVSNFKLTRCVSRISIRRLRDLLLTTPSAPAKERDLFINGAATPP